MTTTPSVPPPETIPPVKISSPTSGGSFGGNCAGTYYPPTGSPSITCSFWKSSDTSGPADASAPATIDGSGGWTATLDMTGVPATTTGVLQASVPDYANEVNNLSWTPPSADRATAKG